MNITPKKNKKGFTLIELLVVIGILVVLATVVVLVLNPAEIFRQARDSKRISDLETLRSAITFYLSTIGSPNLFDDTGCNSNGASGSVSNNGDVAATLTRVDGTGWLPLDFTTDANDVANPYGSPLSALPVDPNQILDDGDFFYQFDCSDDGTFRLSMLPESARYGEGGPDDITTNDGGDQTDRYETGTCLDNTSNACGFD